MNSGLPLITADERLVRSLGGALSRPMDRRSRRRFILIYKDAH